MAIKQASSAHSTSILPSLWFSVHVFASSLQPLVLGLAPPDLSRPSACSGGNSSLALSRAPSWSCTSSLPTIMPTRHRMRCRRARGRGLPSRPPLTHAMGRELNLFMGWEEPSRLEPVNLSAQLSFQLPVPPLASSSICNKKRPRKSTIPTEPAFIPRKMKALPVQSASSSSHCTSNNTGSGDGNSSNSDAENKTENTSQPDAFSKKLDSPASPRP